MRLRCCLYVRVCVWVCVSPLALLGNGSVNVPLSLLGNGSVKIHLSLLGNGSIKNLFVVARQRLGRNVTAVMNTHATKEDLLDGSFSMWPVSYQGK
jgi:hypothetical protein